MGESIGEVRPLGRHWPVDDSPSDGEWACVQCLCGQGYLCTDGLAAESLVMQDVGGSEGASLVSVKVVL